jgi:hypothetical protein
MKNFNFDDDRMEYLEKFGKMSSSLVFKLVDIFNWVVNFFLRNKKMVYTIIVSFILIRVITYFMLMEPKGVYEITTSSGIVYNTNEIQVKDGCVHFKKMNTKEETIICGGVTIVKSK